MKPKRIILVRHAESEGNVDKSIYAHTPDYKVPLTENGEQQSVLAGQEIKALLGDESVHAYVSPWLRTRQTYNGIASVISSNIKKEYEDARLREQDWGHYKEHEFLAKENAARKEYGKFYFRLSDGESGADVYDRISTFLETLHRDFQKDDYPENTLIVTHGVTLLIFCMRWFHWTVEEYESFRNPKNGQVVVLEQSVEGTYKISSKLERYGC